jgi:AraC family transcriptional regulator
MDKAVERAINCIWERYSEPLSLAEIARSALLSRFHFARTFRETTSITPGRFLAAVRIYQAKRMLLTTSLTITDISFAVGYNSLGSFTNHFTDSVGISPGRFRRVSQDGRLELPMPERDPPSRHGAITGTISLPERLAYARVYLGTFASPIVEHRPATAIMVDMAGDSPAPYQLPYVPEGTWFVHAVGVADSSDPEPWTRRTRLIGRHHPVRMTAGAVVRAEFRLRPSLPTDPPILLALPELEPQPAHRRSASGGATAAGAHPAVSDATRSGLSLVQNPYRR